MSASARIEDARTPRLAIVGSCITRDLWPIRGGGAERLLYISRTGFPSLMSPPCAGFVAPETRPDGLQGHEHRAVLADLQKTGIPRLVAFAPTHIVFDFIDDRFDLLAAGGSIVTESAELQIGGYLAQPALVGARRIPRLSAAAERLWLEAAGEFRALVDATPLRRAKLILHSARWAEEQALPDGGRAPVEPIDVVAGERLRTEPHNALLARQEAAFLALFPEASLMAPPDGRRLADPGHRWGLSPFHYIAAYYDDARRRLCDLGLAGAFSDRSDAPSSPAA